MSVQSVQANGIATAYSLEGPAEAPAIAFLNSLASDLRIWDPLLASLAGEYRVLRYDLRGHGETEATRGDYTMRLLADDFVALLDVLGLQRVHLVGLSIGGMIAQQVAAIAGDRVSSLTLLATIAESPKGIWQPRVEAARREGVAPLVGPTLSRWFTAQTHERRPDIVEATGRMISSTSRDGYAGCAAAIRDMQLTPLLGEIRVPTLLVAGAEDTSASPAVMEKMSRAIEGSQFVVLPGTAHMLATERPLELAGLIGGFLQRAQ